MHIEIHNHFDIIKEEHNKLVKIAQDNCNISFFKEVAEKLDEVNIDIRETFGDYLYKCIYPISYKTIAKEKNNGNYISIRSQPAVGKWFGEIVRSNIRYLNSNIFNDLKQDHIDLIPDLKKQKVVQDFFDFKNRVNNFEELVKYPISCSGHLHNFKSVQTGDYKKYIYLTEEHPLDFTTIELGVSLVPYRVIFSIYGDGHKESYLITKRDNKNPNPVINSTVLENINMGVGDKIFFDNPELFLTPEIKSAMLGFVNKGKELQEAWIKLKTKYAYLLLNKGTI